MSINAKQFIECYGDGSHGTCPTLTQWDNVLSRPKDAPLILINLFQLREIALYENDEYGKNFTGEEAFHRYASVSIPAMEKVGGKFLHVGSFGGMFLGGEEIWDVIAIGSYPNLDSFIALYSDKDYLDAFHHRTAACQQQKVLIANY
jgi:uncharacterized protein (DUF1330 family)